MDTHMYRRDVHSSQTAYLAHHQGTPCLLLLRAYRKLLIIRYRFHCCCTSRRGGLIRAARQSAEERRHWLNTPHGHSGTREKPRKRKKAQDIAYLVKQAINGKQLPLV
jgi:hypothetical protein